MRPRRAPFLGLIGATLLLVCGPAPAADLLEIYQLATEQDPAIRAAAAAHRAALEARPQSRALLLPLVAFSASTDRTRQEIKKFGAFPSAIGTSSFGSTGYLLTLNQPIYRREYLVRLRQADAEVARADLEFRDAGQDLIVRVAERYFNVLAARDDLDFAQAEKEAIARQLEETRQRFEVGLIAVTDVHEAQAAFDLATAREIEARNRLESAREMLREITGRRIDQVAALRAEIPLSPPQPADIEQWSDAALAQNLRLLAAEFRRKAVREEVERQRAGHWPTLDLTASLNSSNATGGSFGERDTEEGVIGLQLNVPLYQGGAVSSRVREAAYRLSQAEEELEGQRRAALRQTRDAYLAVQAAINRVTALRQARVSAQSALEAVEAGFEVGTRTTVDVLNARRDLLRAHRDHARARYDYILNTLRLKRAAGLLARADLDQINQWFDKNREQGTQGTDNTDNR